MEHKTRQEKINLINDLCEQAGCSEKIFKLHQTQYIDRSWHPHPPSNFVSWWMQHKSFQDDGLDAVRAYNARHFRDEFETGAGDRYDIPPGEGRKLSRQEIREKFKAMVSTLARQFKMGVEVTVPESGYRDPMVED